MVIVCDIQGANYIVIGSEIPLRGFFFVRGEGLKVFLFVIFFWGGGERRFFCLVNYSCSGCIGLCLSFFILFLCLSK